MLGCGRKLLDNIFSSDLMFYFELFKIIGPCLRTILRPVRRLKGNGSKNNQVRTMLNVDFKWAAAVVNASLKGEDRPPEIVSLLFCCF